VRVGRQIARLACETVGGWQTWEQSVSRPYIEFADADEELSHE
jgi:hypothetical protein